MCHVPGREGQEALSTSAYSRGGNEDVRSTRPDLGAETIKYMTCMIFLSSHIDVQAIPKDIEDLFATGQAADTCPYFGSRRAIPQAQVDFANQQFVASSLTGCSWYCFHIIYYCKGQHGRL